MDNVRLLRQGEILKEWWQEVKEDFWAEDAQRQVRMLLKALMEETLVEDLELQVNRLKEGAPYRNGYYERSLVTRFGLIEELTVPRLREGGFPNRVFGRYQRHQDFVEDLIQEIFLGGISTRKVGEILAPLLGTRVSSSTVSRITRRLDHEVETYHRRPLIDEYQYLILDGITLRVRYNGRYHTRRVLAVYGITVFGRRELLDFRQARGESQASWEALLNDLFHRGLEGKHLKLIGMDGSAGLKAACELIYPHAKIQRCWAHKLRNVSSYCRKKYEKDCLKGAKKIYLAENRREALRRFQDWKAAWQRLCPNAVHCLEKDLEDLLAFLDCPQPHRIKVRTTNVIERSFREVRRRTRVFSCFTNLKSSERIIFAIFSYLNEHWKVKPLKQFTQFI